MLQGFPVPLVGFFAELGLLNLNHSFVAKWVAPALAILGALLLIVMLIASIWTGLKNLSRTFKKIGLIGIGLIILAGVVYILSLYSLLLLIAYFAFEMIFEN